MRMTGKIRGGPGSEPPVGLLLAALPGEEDVSHDERDVYKPANAVQGDKAKREKPQDKQDRRNIERQQSDQHACQYLGTNSKLLAQIPQSMTSNVAPYGASGTRRIFLAHRFGFQAFALGRAQLLQQPTLKAFVDHSACATLSMSAATQVASITRAFNHGAPSGAENFNHA